VAEFVDNMSSARESTVPHTAEEEGMKRRHKEKTKNILK
jgi:hypothetical protein